MSRDLQNLSIRVEPQDSAYSNYTIPSSAIISFNPGEKKETVTQSDPALDGSVATLIKKNNSRDSSTLKIKIGTTAEAKLDDYALNDVECIITIIDESSTEYGKEMVGSDVFFSDPGAAFEDTDKEYTLMIGDYSQKRV